MLQAMKTSLAGIRAYQQSLDLVAGNLANQHTNGYKRLESHFSDLLYASLRERRMPLSPEASVAASGGGARLAAVVTAMEQGAIGQSFRTLDLAVEGDGFFRLVGANGQANYTRNGAFYLDGAGRLTSAGGNYLDVDFVLDGEEAHFVTVTPDGRVTVTEGSGQIRELGTIRLYRFANPNGLLRDSEGCYRPTAASGPPQEGIPGEDGFGRIWQYALERSNVDISREMVNMLRSHRAMQSALRCLVTADELNGSALQVTV